MPITTVTATAVYPAKGKGPAAIKDAKGRYLKFWTRTIPERKFQAGGTYKIEYHVEDYKGEDQYYIDEILGESVTNAGTVAQAGADSVAKEERIAALALMKCLDPLPLDTEKLANAYKVCIAAHRRVVEWQRSKNIESGPRRPSLEEELDDQVPFLEPDHDHR